ncbi:MAG: hypothetical protein ACREFQ_17655 [Stellaceae bacterium]
MKMFVRAALGATLVIALGGTAFAQRDEHHDGHFRGERFRGDIHRFGDHDLDFWRSGRWFHGVHEGRRGWWWTVGPSWYFYPAPFYPYPDPYLPPTVAPGAAPLWYYCTNPPGYYPYVAACAVPWRPVVPR